MNQIIYDCGIFLYGLAIKMLSPFNPKAREFLAGRRNIFDRLEKVVDMDDRPVVWFHCASLGEFEQGRPVMELFREEYGQSHAILLTFFSPSGYEVRKNYSGADHIFYLPLDTAGNAYRFLKITRPKFAFFVKYEFWHHYLHTAYDLDIPLVCFSAVFRNDQVFFKSYGQFYRRLLTYLDHIFVQDIQSKKLLRMAGLKNVSVAGDTRFDRVHAHAVTAREIPEAARFKGQHLLMVVGSCWPEDFETLLPLLNDLEANLRFIIAPHEPEAGEIDWMRKKLKRKSLLFSQAAMADLDAFEVLMIDNVGMLSALYQYGDLAYVGGAFSKGLHNILEPAAFGMPIFFGPRHEKFIEASELISAGAAMSISNGEELHTTVKKLLNDSIGRIESGMAARAYVERNQGASEKIMEYCKEKLKVTL